MRERERERESERERNGESEREREMELKKDYNDAGILRVLSSLLKFNWIQLENLPRLMQIITYLFFCFLPII